MELSKLKPENAKAIAIILVVVVLIVVGIVYITKTFGSLGNIFSNITNKLGLSNDPQEQQARDYLNGLDVSSQNINSPFSPALWKNAPAGTHLLTVANGDAIAKQIWDSVGWFTTSPEEALGALKQCNYQSQVSWVADRFNINYSKDLYAWMGLQYTSTQQVEVLQMIVKYCTGLPKY